MRKFFHQRSLRLRLITFLSTLSLVVWAMSAVIQWQKVEEEINRMFDTHQILFAERLASSNIMSGFHHSQPRPRNIPKKHIDSDALAFAIFTEKGDLIFNDGRNGKYFHFKPTKGFSHIQIYQDDGDVEEWRLFWLKQRDVFIVVGQEMEYRRDLISKLVLTQLWGWLIGLPIMIIAILLIISYEFRSVRKLEKVLRKRKPDETEKLSLLHIPSEIEPLVNTLNHHFERTNLMFERERRFTSDAAHELRSPLAGLRLQTEIAQMSLDDPNTLSHCLTNMTNSIDRITQLIEQLLTLSRLENMNTLDELEQLHWPHLIETAVTESYSLAEQKQTDISVNIISTPQHQGKPLLISLILRNLLENAINYTQQGSFIRLSLSKNAFTIEDNGQGVSDQDLLRLGQPFFRPIDRPFEATNDQKGSGLGLSIIRRIAQLHGFSLQFSHSELGGLKVEIQF